MLSEDTNNYNEMCLTSPIEFPIATNNLTILDELCLILFMDYNFMSGLQSN